ncbi:high-affinity branched-chain amino acid ABC transporter permease LivM [Desulfurobacterium atlanticum]|uniref:Branched-chain amino acid transport system permease protein n=1 Tax=Desulfurobacterium atlanticum TaxID=240169 RepID=A0A238ZVD6_9BACT|nr:high-affinity branched-chain amino acid ABC transporter permease LivM [Desulfurobacterium atlanticum]SNR86868.1 branched-chain amino acid transport system permease protein [Desulfurobacterium atlanticum]
MERVVEEMKKSLITALWFVFLTFPIMVIKLHPAENSVSYRWNNVIYVFIGAFFLSMLWRYLLERRDKKAGGNTEDTFIYKLLNHPYYSKLIYLSALVFILVFPLIFSSYQTNIMTTALIYVVLGLGLNIVVGLAGLLDLGYVAFYAVGAYGYALLNKYFGLGFWAVFPIAGILAAIAGIILVFPILRLRGDYLAIVTLGFGEIIRIVLENWDSLTNGPSGISGIPRPSLFGIKMNVDQSLVFIYYITVALVIFTIFVVNRLQNSRLGRAWLALKEDEIACQAMGIDRVKAKLSAFALGATWAGFAGVIFAAKTTFVNPASFTFFESVVILAIVVLGGMGSIVGVIIAALMMILLPEYLRAFSDYRMLVFGLAMVLVMVFRPEGLIPFRGGRFVYKKKELEKDGSTKGAYS